MLQCFICNWQDFPLCSEKPCELAKVMPNTILLPVSDLWIWFWMLTSLQHLLNSLAWKQQMTTHNAQLQAKISIRPPGGASMLFLTWRNSAVRADISNFLFFPPAKRIHGNHETSVYKKCSAYVLWFQASHYMLPYEYQNPSSITLFRTRMILP